MKHGPPTLARLVAWSVLLLGLSAGCGAGCGGDPVVNPPGSSELADADRSSVEVSKTSARADGKDSVDIRVVVRKADGTPLPGQTVKVTVSGEGNTVTQPVGTTDAEGVATAQVSSTVVGTKTVTATVDATSGPVTLTQQPSIEFNLLPASRLAFTTSPRTGTAGAALGTFEVAIQNADGSVMTGATNTITVAIGSGPAAAALEGTLSVPAVNGVARFSNLVLKVAAQGYTLVASAEGLSGATSPAFNVAPAAAASLVLAPTSASVTAGSPLTLELTARDAYGNTATGYAGTVRFTSDAAGTLPADYTFTSADEGHHTFTDGIVLTQAGSHTVTVTDTANASLTASTAVTVAAGGAARLAFTKQPGNHSVRAAFDVAVMLLDASGNPVAGSAPAVTLSLNKGGTLAGTTTVDPVAGVASFTGLSIAEENTGYVLTASGAGLAAATSDTFTITDDVAPTAPVLAQAATTLSSITVAWTAVGDDGDLGTASSYDLRYSATNIVTDADFAAATPVTVGAPKAAGSAESALISGFAPGSNYYVALKVTDNAGNATRSATLPVSTPNPTASKLAFTVQPQNGTAGTALAPFKVAIQDPDGVLVGNATSAVTLTVQGVTGYGPFTVNAVGGVATFDAVRIDTAGKGYTLVASSGGLTSATSNPFDISAAAASRLALSGLSDTVTARKANSVTVTVSDAYGNAAESYTGTVSFSSSDTAATLPASYAFTAADKGVHTFSGVVLKTTGPQFVTVSAPGLTGATKDVTVVEPPPGTLVLAGVPATVTAGDVLTVTVERLDGSGARDTTYTGTVHFTSTDAKAVLPADYTFTDTDAGFKTFTVKLLTAGAQSLTVTDKASSTLTSTANTTVGWAAVASLTLDAPDTAVAGNPFSARVTVSDAYGNTVKDYTGTVGFSSTPSGATVPGDYAFVTTDEGSRLFDFTLKTTGSTTLTVTDAARGLSASDTVAVSHAAVASLELVAPTTALTAGTAFTVDVTAKDAFGNVATGYTGTVGFSSGDAQAVLPADTAFTTGDLGHKSFSVTLKTAGDQPVTVKDKDPSKSFLAATATVHIDAGSAAKLAFRDPPTGAKVRATFTPVTVAITDAFGNTVSASSPDITVALAGGNPAAVLSGTLTATPVGGIATFSTLSVDQQGTGFRLDAMGGTLDGASSSPFTIVDDVAPKSPTLTVAGMTSIQVTLAWTAVGDDGVLGNATSYDLRYATSPIDVVSFDSAAVVPVGTPQASGTAESALVTGLSPSTHYYFALKVKDDAGNASVLALVDTTTNVDPCAGYTCAAPSATCAPDGVSKISYSEKCVDVDNAPTCQQSQVTTACPGTNAVCFQGACDTAASPAANTLSISEVMHSPSSSTTEYIELTNNTSNLLNLNGLTVTYTASSGTIVGSTTVGSGSSVPVVIARKGTFVLAQNKTLATNGGVSANYAYGSAFTLDGSGSIKLTQGSVLVEELQYTSAFPQTTGKAMNLSSLVVGTKANAQPWYWCDSDVKLAGGDYGTPNAPNSTCGMTVTPPMDYCAIQYPKTFPSPDASYPASVTPGSSWIIYSRFYEPSVTDRNTAGNDYYPYVFAELGYGTDATNPAGWTWSPASYNGGYATSSEPNNDEMLASLSIPTAGTYNYGFRYRFQDPATGSYSAYTYCDQSGAVTPPAGTYGSVKVATSTPPLTNHVVISEFSGGNGSGTAATDEFVELYNPTDSPVDLNGWTVQYKSATGTAYSGTVTINSTTAPGGTIIQPKKYFLLVGANYSGSAPKDVSYTFDASASTTAGGHIRIGPGLDPTNVNDPKTVDKLGYGTGNSPEGSAAPAHPAAGGSLERKAVSTSTSATMAVGGSDANRGNGYDSDNNSTDFVTRATRQPQSSASPAETP